MNKQEFGKGIKILEMSYNQLFTQEKLDFWWRQLQDLNADKFFNNIKQQIKTNPFMPNIAQIRNENTFKQYANYEQRDYSNVDFDELFANHIPTI